MITCQFLTLLSLFWVVNADSVLSYQEWVTEDVNSLAVVQIRDEHEYSWRHLQHAKELDCDLGENDEPWDFTPGP